MKHKPRVLLIGDLMIDEWVYGDVNRLSPEAPIPIVDIQQSKIALGGAGNVLNNLNALGAETTIISGVSNTYHGDVIKKLVYSGVGEENALFFKIPHSFKKQRICSGQQQIVRIDSGQGRDITDVEIEDFINKVRDKIDIIVIADYGKGAVTETVIADLSQYGHQHGIDVLIDPYMRDYYYGGGLSSTLIKFNRLEAENFTNIRITNNENLQETGRILLDTFDTKSVLITLGPNGMAYFDRGKNKKIPYLIQDNPVHVYDVCGAGDVVMAVLAYLMTYNGKFSDMRLILKYAARAGKMAVSKKGTSVVNHDELFPTGLEKEIADEVA